MKSNVLVFPCGSQPALDINFCLRESMRYEVFGATSVEDHGQYVYKNYINQLPTIFEQNFILELNKQLSIHKIQYIIPTHDTIALYLMEHQDSINATIVSSNLETTKICRYKSLTYQLFSDHTFTPITFNSNNINEYPVFLKPDSGQGGRGTYLVNSNDELHHYLNRYPDLLICEYLPGEEITIDCFTDRNSLLHLISPRTRERVFGGISVHSKIIEATDEIIGIATTLNQRLSFRGYWYFQLKKDRDGNYKLLEVSTRMAGTFALSMNLDINLPLLSLLDFTGLDIEISPNNYSIELDRSFINRYRLDLEYERIYVDFDDTLILRNQYCNEYLIMFLYQCLNKNKEIILITKHTNNVYDTLQTYKISPLIFTDIIHLKESEKKYNFIRIDKKCIFIDNSFAERKEVKNKLHIPTFDINNIECLLDWRG